MNNREQWHIGLDAGGTKTALLAVSADAGNEVRLTGGGANLQRRGVQATARTLADLVKSFREEAVGREVISICAGVSGAGRPHEQRALEEEMRRQLDGDRSPAVCVVHDAEIALEAAFEGESGIIVITGTGSIIFARTDDGDLLRAGGWGYLLGDDGSGFTLGRSGLRKAAAQYDGGPETRISALLAKHHGIRSTEDLIHAVYQKDLAIAEVAPLVIEAAAGGDGVAEKAVGEIIAALVTQVSWLLNRADGVRQQIALLGGLTNEAYYRERLAAALSERFPGWSVGAPRHKPVVGALRLAQQAVGMAGVVDGG